MKVSGARTEGYGALGRPAAGGAGAGGRAATARSAPAVSAAFLGLIEADLTPRVQSALNTLLGEIDELRAEVARLKARLEEAETLADLDPVTPALNRRAFLRELHRVSAFTRRYGSPASLAFFDLDRFKAVNDRFGHAAGDAALKAVAERLRAQVRESDIVARIGGDEFAVILMQADVPVAEARAAALAAAIEAEPVSFGEWSAPLHLSYGVTAIDPDTPAEAMLAQADAAMYARKRMRDAG